MKNYFRRNYKLLFAALFLTVIFCYPYLFKDFLGMEHDTFFHISRIQGLADALSRGNFRPMIYPYKNANYGYASPLFYCDFFLILPSLLYNAGMSLASCYKFFIFACSFFSCYAMMCLLQRITSKQWVAILAGAAYLFCNYRITDVYVRGATGEVTAMIFLPVILSGLYEILEKRNTKYWPYLCMGISGLLLSHNLTFAFGVVIVVLLACIYLKKMNKEIFFALCKAAGIAFLLTAWFSLPMIEQSGSQEFFLHSYATGSDLASQAMMPWQFFANTTVFGMGGNTYPVNETMLENVGWFLTFAPLLWFFVKKEDRKEHPFVLHCLILGYIFMILPSSFFPWKDLSFLRVMQFPWRLNTISSLFLCVPSCAAFAYGSIGKQKWLAPVCIGALLLEGCWHLAPALNRWFGITSQTTYQDILSGSIVDPYYSAFYVRVECAGGDYLPVGSPDFRVRSSAIQNENHEDLPISSARSGTNYTFTIPDSSTNGEIILPITYYKGYQVYVIENGQMVKVNTYESDDKMVAFDCRFAGDYICKYDNTLIQNMSLLISILTLCGCLWWSLKDKIFEKE